MKNKANLKYYIILAIGFILVVLVQYTAPKPIDWRNSYTQKDKIPYGCFLLKDLMPDLFPDKTISTSKLPAYNELNNYSDATYVIINSVVEMDKLDTEKLVNFVSEGNDVFISAERFLGQIADTLKIETAINDKVMLDKNPTYPKINFENPNLKKAIPYQYDNKFMPYSFTSVDTSLAVVLAQDNAGKIYYISMKYGKGKLYLNTMPKAFSNYYLTDSLNSDYAYRALSYLSNKNIIWDEYYKNGKRIVTTPIRYILGEPALKMAYIVLVISLLVYIVFNVKRKQRIIPVLTPLKNETLGFVNIVGTLYFQRKNHFNLAQKKIQYFLAFARENYNLKTTVLDSIFITSLINKSGVQEDVVKDLIGCINKVNNGTSEKDLMELHLLIRKFHEQKIR